MSELCDRCKFDPATHEADEVIKQYFPQYENLCGYDFRILHLYAAVIMYEEKIKG